MPWGLVDQPLGEAALQSGQRSGRAERLAIPLHRRTLSAADFSAPLSIRQTPQLVYLWLNAPTTAGDWLERRQHGVHWIEHVKDRVHLVLLEAGVNPAQITGLPEVAGIAARSWRDKLGPAFVYDPQRKRDILVRTWSLVTDAAGGKQLQLGHRVIRARSLAEAEQIARRATVLRVTEHVDDKPLIDRTRRVLGSDDVNKIDLSQSPPQYLGVSGKGVKIAVVDTGVDADHPDFHRFDSAGNDLGSRVVGEKPGGSEPAHGTRVAGVISGSGRHSESSEAKQEQEPSPYSWRGHAPEIDKIVALYFGGLSGFTNLYKQGLQAHNTYLSNHSHTITTGPYNDATQAYDSIPNKGTEGLGDPVRPPRVVVFAAANSGNKVGFSDATFKLQGYYSILAGPKNAIVVGGTNGNDLTYMPSSSKGPTLDGRLKPDVVAIGGFNYGPLDGAVLEIAEIRLVGKAPKPDRVWTFNKDGDMLGWTVEDGFDDAQVKNGFLRTTTYVKAQAGALRFYATKVDGKPIEATDYERLEVKMRVAIKIVPDIYTWTRFWAVRWDTNGDEGVNGEVFPQYDKAKRTPGVIQTHQAKLNDQWKGQIHWLRIRPFPYDNRVVVLEPGAQYGVAGATSIAAPMVSGIISLMIDRLIHDQAIDFENAPPLPSTIKAIVIHTAIDLEHTQNAAREPDNPDTKAPVQHHLGPDFATGYGRVDARGAIALIDAHKQATKWREAELSEGQTHNYQLRVDRRLAGSGPLKLTLVWDDMWGSPELKVTASQLVNDLDIVVIDPAGKAHFPWHLPRLPYDDATIASGIDPIKPTDVKAATRCARDTYWTPATSDCEDHQNNVEQVLIDAPVAGNYKVLVRGKAIPQGPQKYSLVLSQSCTP